MIKNKQDYYYYLEADRIAKAIPRKRTLTTIIKEIFFPNYIWQFQKQLRKLEYIKNCKKDILSKFIYFILFIRFKRLSRKLGFSIPLNVFGPGLSIAHFGNIVINSATKIGANCRIHIGVNIGTEAGFSTHAPSIGDNCYIGPGAKIFGSIHITDNVAIGANAVVTKSVDEGNIAIGGVPAKKLSDVNLFTKLIPATIIIDKHLVDIVEPVIVKSGSNLTQEIFQIISK